MKIYFNACVIVASLVTSHPQNSLCWPWFNSVVRKKNEGYIGDFALAEIYATLSSMPVRPAPSPADVRQIVRDSVQPYFQVVDLETGDYDAALDLAANALLRSVSVYDALAVAVARRNRIKHVVTLNSEILVDLCGHNGIEIIDPLRRQP